MEARLVLPERLNLRGFPGPLCSSHQHRKSLLQSSSETKGGGLGPPPKQRDLSASGRCSCGDLVKGGIGNLIGLYLRSSVNHLRQGLRYFGVSFAVVGFRVLCPVPQTDAKCFLSSRCDKRDFVLESLLFSKQGNDLPFQSLGELGNAALQMHGDFACKHVNLLGWLTKGDSDNLLWYREPESSLSSLTKIG